MGNLAERYKDPERSGVYRVSSPDVPVLAAREACAELRECDAADLESELTRAVRQLAGQSQRRPCILLVRDAVGQSATDFQQGSKLMRHLQTAVEGLGSAVHPCFVVLVDPLKILDLPNLWREPAASPNLEELQSARLPETPCATWPAADHRRA